MMSALSLIASVFVGAQAADGIDFTTATVVVRSGDVPIAERTAAEVLVEEVEQRTGLRWTVSEQWPEQGTAIALCSGGSGGVAGRDAPDGVEATAPEGYAIATDLSEPGHPVLWILGADGRGALFGVGRVLRAVEWEKGSVRLPDALNEASTPAYAIRGHQLGYRHRANSWDAWTVDQFEQYIRELTFFGLNCIENIPFEDDRPSPVMKVSREVMNRELGAICAKYDLDYWVWSPATFDLNDHEKRQALLDKHDAFFADCPRLDAVFFPGGDPGHNHPELVMPFLKDLSELLVKHHPKAGVWISLQGFDDERVGYFYEWLEEHEPNWLAGVVSGPGSPPIPETRQRLPERYQLRHYPDITHTVRCQYPTPWWDPAFSFTLGRECTNPEPLRYAEVHNHFAPYTNGFLAYSDGIHDDVNKVVWSAMGWDTTADVRQVLIEYSRVFFGPAVAEEAADGILALERNWSGPAATNGGIDATLALWQRLEGAHPGLLDNWRWQQCLLRAYYDAYTRHRLLYETELEQESFAVLAAARETGADSAMDAALAVLARAETERRRPELRQRVVELCEALFQSIGLQTSVEKYHASGVERGAVLDLLDIPLNDRWWIEDEFAKIRKLGSEEDKCAQLDRIRTWERPFPGALYDDIGNVAKSPHVIRGEGTNTDPNNNRNPNPDAMWWEEGRTRARRSWVTYMDWPLGLRYDGLDPKAGYVVRTTGNGDCLLRINGIRMQPVVDGREMGELKEFPVPRQSYEDGSMVLTFDRPYEPGINWRHASRLTEVWLIKR
jgi:hypothetical protein